MIFGYTIWNDVSARDVQARELPIGMGPAKAKDWDGSNVLGPCVVTADELDAGGLAMSVRVNGETWGEDSSASMHWGFGDMIAYASRARRSTRARSSAQVRPPAGRASSSTVRWAPVTLIELEIEGIGVLRNRIGAKGAA